MREASVVVEDLHKSYGDVKAVDGVSFRVEPGTVLGLLGPNGAGKTTTVHILTTLLKPDSGTATVAGYDVRRDASKLRSVIGLAGQYAAVDEILTGRENLDMVGQLYHLSKDVIQQRSRELLERFSLEEAADRQVKTYSGGMRRRLDLGASLLARPEVLFLDEPTTGLDPRGRNEMWEVIKGLVKDGTTLLLTTQYLEEADNLADRIAVIDGGKLIAQGTADELKTRVGGDVIEVTVSDRSQLSNAVNTINHGDELTSDETNGRIRLSVKTNGAARLGEVVRKLDSAKIAINDIALHRPTLDDVFLTLTGRTAEDQTIKREGRGRKSSENAA